MKRKLITIDEEKCNGCGLCIPGCPEGALQIIDGKARLISDLFCDGLGACIGECPEGAISIVEKEAQPYDEKRVMENIIKGGKNVIKAHLTHLIEHGQTEYLKEAMEVLENQGIEGELDEEITQKIPVHRTSSKLNEKPIMEEQENYAKVSGCPGLQTLTFDSEIEGENMNKNNSKITKEPDIKKQQSELTHWPIQLHLLYPTAPHFRGSDFLLSADCTAFSAGNFHTGFLKGKTLAIACPKLDSHQEVYFEKITALIDEAEVNTITVVTMEVPCCNGLLNLVIKAQEAALRKCPVKWIVLSLRGNC